MKNIAIIALAVGLENENGYSRFRFLANLLCDYYNVDLITSTFQHWEKKHRNRGIIESLNTRYNIKLAYEPGYKKNVDIRRLYSHRVATKNIIKILEHSNYDLIYCTIPDNHMAASVGEYAKRKGIKYVVDIEDLWPEAMEMVSPFPKKMNKYLFSFFRKEAKFAYECADAFIGTSNEYRDIPKNKYEIKGKPALTVYVGCDLDEFDRGVQENVENIKKDNNEFWITYAGTLGSSYDIPTLIRTAQKIYAEYPNIKFKVLGGGPLENEFKSIADAEDCNVEFVGYTPYREMAAYLDKSDALINSFVRKAPQSIVTKIGDYLAAGKPMINTLSSQEFCSKVTADGFGINVPAEEVKALYDSIIELYSNSEKRITMGRKARYIAETQFDRKKSYLKIKELIDSLLERNVHYK